MKIVKMIYTGDGSEFVGNEKKFTYGSEYWCLVDITDTWVVLRTWPESICSDKFVHIAYKGLDKFMLSWRPV